MDINGNCLAYCNYLARIVPNLELQAVLATIYVSKDKHGRFLRTGNLFIVEFQNDTHAALKGWTDRPIDIN